jgi:predicted secreted Zn-dependent protease
MKSRTNLITLPKALPQRSYITKSGGQWHPGDVALAMALVIRIHNTADAIRKLAWQLKDKVCLEHQPNMKRLSREPDDQKVWNAALKIVNRVCEMWKISPEIPFLINKIVPKCHLREMLWDKDANVFRCQFCSHSKVT